MQVLLRHPLAPVLVLACETVIFYSELLHPGWILADYDVWSYFYPLREYAAQAVRAGRFPTWNPDTFLGAPFFANPQTSMLYPGSALFYLLPVGYAYSLSIVVHVLLAALFTYSFLRCSLGTGRIAATFGASCFAFGGFLSSQVGHINQLSASAWLPAVLLAADLAWRRRSARWTIAAMAALTIQLLAGHAQESYMTLWVLVGLCLWRTISRADGGQAGDGGVVARLVKRSISIAAVGLITVAGAFALAAVQLLPTAELSRYSIRGGGLSYAEATSFSLPPMELARALLPGYWMNPFGEHIGYVGVVGLTVAVIGFVAGRYGPALWAGSLCAVGVGLALGAANPLYGPLVEAVPGMDLFRVPSRWLFIYSFGIAALAALGVDLLLRPGTLPAPEGLRRAPRAYLVAGSAVAVLLLSHNDLPGRVVLLWLAGITAGIAMVAAVRFRPGLPTAALLLFGLVIELRLAAMDLATRYPVTSALAEIARPVTQHLQAGGTEGRVLSVARTEYELPDHQTIMPLNERRPPTADFWREVASLVVRAAGAKPDALPETQDFWFSTAVKLREVMSPNVPLRDGLAAVDGYDGGVLPLRRYVDLLSTVVPEGEMRSDGVIRTRLIASPQKSVLDLFRVRALIANEVSDVTLRGISFDVATARTLKPGESLRVDLTSPLAAGTLWMLSSYDAPADQMPRARVILHRQGGTTERHELVSQRDVYSSASPGPDHATQPTAGPSREGLTDSATAFPVAEGPALSSIEWHWEGPGTWNLRGTTLVATDGSRHQIGLQPGLRKIAFPPLKVYERQGGSLYPLRTAIVQDDQSTLAAIQEDRSRLSGPAMIAEETVIGGLALPETQDPTAPGTFRRLKGSPEHLVFERAGGSGGGFLLVDDAWFPGWVATVDGREAPVYRAQVLFKAVPVDQGARRVDLHYQPRLLYVGALISIVTALILIPIFIRGRLR